MTDLLVDDMIIYIMTYLNDKNKLLFLSLSKQLHFLKTKVYWNDYVCTDKIYGLSYYDMFTHVISNLNHKLPNSITHLSITNTFNQDIKGCHIPNSITHLSFGNAFNKDIKGCIPNSVTHLHFGYYFNQHIKDCIPNSVKHLKFGSFFDQDIRNCIPSSVTFLYFGNNFNQNIK